MGTQSRVPRIQEKDNQFRIPKEDKKMIKTMKRRLGKARIWFAIKVTRFIIKSGYRKENLHQDLILVWQTTARIILRMSGRKDG